MSISTEVTQPNLDKHIKQRDRKCDMNKRMNKRLQEARKEYNRMGLKNKAINFVNVMHLKQVVNSSSKTKVFPWFAYSKLSKEWSQTEDVDCELPEVDGLHILLREMSSKMFKNEKKKKTTSLPDPSSLSVLADAASLSPRQPKMQSDTELKAAAKILSNHKSEDSNARLELKRLGLVKEAKAFVLLMHKNGQKPFPWVKYHELSQLWGGPVLPKIEGVHLILRCMSSKMSK